MASDAKVTEYSFEFRYHGPVCYIWIDFHEKYFVTYLFVMDRNHIRCDLII